jgi:hypothetical protein
LRFGKGGKSRRNGENRVKKRLPAADILRNPAHPQRRRLPQSGPQGVLIAAVLATAAALWFLSGTLPVPLVLPVVSTFLILAAALVAILAWRRPAIDPHLPNYWDVSGALTMAGIGAALLSEPDAVLPLLEAHLPAEKTATRN